MKFGIIPVFGFSGVSLAGKYFFSELTSKTMKKLTILLVISFLFSLGCTQISPIEVLGQHYQQHHDYASLRKVVELMKPNADTSYVKSILGEPIDMGFDYRYLVDSVGPKNCSIGAVFHINEKGHIDQKWIDEICE